MEESDSEIEFIPQRRGKRRWLESESSSSEGVSHEGEESLQKTCVPQGKGAQRRPLTFNASALLSEPGHTRIMHPS